MEVTFYVKRIVAGLVVIATTQFLAVPITFAFDFAIHGYYRSRVEYYHDLDTQRPNSGVNQGGLGDNDRVGSILFSQQRFRLEPWMKINDNI